MIKTAVNLYWVIIICQALCEVLWAISYLITTTNPRKQIPSLSLLTDENTELQKKKINQSCQQQISGEPRVRHNSWLLNDCWIIDDWIKSVHSWEFQKLENQTVTILTSFIVRPGSQGPEQWKTRHLFRGNIECRCQKLDVWLMPEHSFSWKIYLVPSLHVFEVKALRDLRKHIFHSFGIFHAPKMKLLYFIITCYFRHHISMAFCLPCVLWNFQLYNKCPF